ncbi:hypothetical protein PAPHI01_2111 [Pancytospora philotis]|nr:hypothetical protein PAPHI01_2111 [Pancytospora philotis]
MEWARQADADPSVLDDEELCEAVFSNPERKYPDEAVARMLGRQLKSYAKLFYTLSASNRTLCARTYKDTHLHKGYDSFGEEDLMYLCEGIKLQLAMGLDDFYLITHYFFRRLPSSPQLCRFLMFLMADCDFRLREFLVSHDVAAAVLGRPVRTALDEAFAAKFVKSLVELNSSAIEERILGSDTAVTLRLSSGYSDFFVHWLERCARRFKDYIQIQRCDATE